MPQTRSLARYGSIAALTLGMCLVAPAAGATAVAPRAALFSTPSAITAIGPWLVVANRGSSTLSVLRASNGALAGRARASLLATKSPDSIVSATVAGRRLVFVSGSLGPASVLSIASRAGGAVFARLRVLRPTGCAKVGTTHLATDSAGHVFEACSNGVVTEWSAATGAVVRSFSAATTGLTNATSLVVRGAQLFVTNAATSAAGSAPDGVVQLSLATGARVKVVTNATNAAYGFSTPSSISSDGTHLWVTSIESDSIDELSATTLAFQQSSTTNLYNPGSVLATKTFVFASSVDGPVSSMVTQFVLSGGSLTSPWMMCNTNDAYKFDDPSGMALNAGSLWVTNAANNLVDRMNESSGLLVKTIS